MAGSEMTPEYLVKEELLFEVRCRGVAPGPDVNALRTQLRGLLISQPIRERFEGYNFDEEVIKCQQKYEDWEGQLEDLKEEPPVGREKARAVTKLSHLEGRLSMVMEGGAGASSEIRWAQGALEQVQSMLVLLRSTGNPVARAGRPGEVTNRVAAVGNDSLPIEGDVGGQNRGYGLNLQRHTRLPNPLAPLLQGIPVADGLDVEQLLMFLDEALRVREVALMNDREYLEHLIPYCRPPLFDYLGPILSSGRGFDDFHSKVLNLFIPDRFREELKLKKIYGPQGPRESLAVFVRRVKVASRALKIGLPEVDIVGIILEGLTPEVRCQLVFANRPRSFLELDRLVVDAAKISFIDQRRKESAELVERRPVCTRECAREEAPQRREWRGPPPVCFSCGKSGHISRVCRSGRARQPKNE